VVVILGPQYPKRVWTRFESEQFRHRFGENAVISIWSADVDYSVFDQSRDFGGLTIDRTKDMKAQVVSIANHLAERLAQDRAEAAAAATVESDDDTGTGNGQAVGNRSTTLDPV